MDNEDISTCNPTGMKFVDSLLRMGLITGGMKRRSQALCFIDTLSIETELFRDDLIIVDLSDNQLITEKY